MNQHVIRKNAQQGQDEPVLTVKGSRRNDYAHEVIIFGQDGLEAARLVYRAEDPLSCGARVWLETRGAVKLVLRTPEISPG